MKTNRKKSKVILLSLLVLCLIFSNTDIKAQPQMNILSCPSSIEPDETINIHIEFVYENEFQIIQAITFRCYINDELILNDTSQLSQLFNGTRPASWTIAFNTNGLNLVNGDVVNFLIICYWGSFVTFGGILENTTTVNIHEEGTSIDTGTVVVIIFCSLGFAVIVSGLVVIILMKRHEKGKR